MSKLLAHFRGNLVAYLALFVALSGSAYAATALPRNSVGTKQIKKRAVNGAKVKKNTLTGVHIRESKLAQVPLAARALNADNAANAARAGDAATLGGQPPSAFLAAGAKAADAATLNGQPPSAFLGATGKAADADKLDGIDSSVFGTVQTHVGTAFGARDESATGRDSEGTGAISCDGTPEDFVNDVHLPQGAIVTGLDFQLVDNDAVNNAGLSLVAFDALGNAPSLSDNIVTVATSGAEAGRRTLTSTIDGEAIDNTTWGYALVWSPFVCSSNMQLVGGGIHYEMPTG